jgi:hypothetical protein
MRSKGCLLLVLRTHMDLPVATITIYLTKYSSIPKGINTLINLWNRVGVSHRNGIQPSVIDT